MKFWDRLLIFFQSIGLAIVLFWYFGSLLFFVLPALGVIYLAIGGIHHA